MRYYNFASTAGVVLFFAIGCTSSSPTSTHDASANNSGNVVVMDDPPPATVDVHTHPSVGPHHGSLVELGNEEFHAEVVHDDKSVTVYVLDASASKAVPIDAQDLTFNLIHDGKPEQFKLAASPDAGDPSGKSSRFTLVDADLASHIDDASAAPKLMLTINGTPYRGEIKHAHDHGASAH